MGSADVFVRPGENSHRRRRGTLPFSRDLHKISIPPAFREISASHEYPRTNISSLLFSRIYLHLFLSSLCDLLAVAFVKLARLGLTNGTTKEESLFSRVCPISRLHPSFLYAPPSSRPRDPFAQFARCSSPFLSALSLIPADLNSCSRAFSISATDHGFRNAGIRNSARRGVNWKRDRIASCEERNKGEARTKETIDGVDMRGRQRNG